MFLTDEQARARLDSDNNLANKFGKKENSVSIIEVPILRPGKKGPELTVEQRTEIATRSRLGEETKVLQEEFNTSQAEVSFLKNGKVKSINENKVEEVISSVRDKALDRLMASLGLLNDDKLSGCSAKDLSVIASNMGRVVEKTMPKSDQSNNINLIIFSPELRKEASFEVVEI